MKARPLRRIAMSLGLLLLATSTVSGEESQQYDVKSIDNHLNEAHAHLTVVSADDNTCSHAFRLTETDGEAEHVVYGDVRFSSDMWLTIEARAHDRYALQVGFATSDWQSYAIASVNLISGASTAAEGGQLHVKELIVNENAANWKEIKLHAVVQSSQTASQEGYALVKLIANGQLISYSGLAGHGVELCARQR
jgi:hypothetical protein